MLAKYDQDVVKNLMPLIVNVLGKTVLNIRTLSIQYGVRYGTGLLVPGTCIHVPVVYKRLKWK